MVLGFGFWVFGEEEYAGKPIMNICDFLPSKK
jgi:hypothetical protein